MGNLLPRDILFFAGGDCLAKYGTLARRTWPADRGGEQVKETFTRTGSAWAVGKNGLYVPHAANVPRVEWAIDPVTGVQQPYLLLEAAGTNLIENSDYEVDAVGSAIQAGTSVARSTAQAFNGVASLLVTCTNNGDSGVFITKRDGTRTPAAAGTTYSFSAWVYAPAASVGKNLYLLLQWFTAASGGSQVGANVPSSIYTLVAGWQRLTMTALAPATTVAVNCFVLTNGPQGVITFHVDVPQFEASAFATSAIPTGTGAVTRNAESFFAPYYTNPQAGDWLYVRLLETGGALVNGYPSYFTLGDGNTPTLRIFGSNQNVANTYGVAFWNTANIERDIAGGAMGNVIEVYCGLDQNLNFLSQLAVNGAVGALVSTPVAQALPAAWGGGFKITLGGPARFSRAVHGLGCGTSVATLADARAVNP